MSVFINDQEKSQKKSLLKNIREGFRYLLQRSHLCAIYSVQLLLMVNFLTAPILLIPFAKNILMTTTVEYGIIQASFSFGVILGGITSSLLVELFGLKKILLGKTIGVLLFFFCFALVSNLWLANLFYFLIGFCLISWTLVVTKAQMLTDANFLGRVQSVFNALAALFVLGVFFLISIIGDLIPMRVWYGLEIVITSTAFYLLWLWRNILE